MDVRSFWIRSNTSLLTAIEALDRSEQGMIVAVDLDNRLIGGVTQQDIRQALIEGAQLSTPVSTFLRADLPVIASTGDSIQRSRQHGRITSLNGTTPGAQESVPPFPYITVLDEAGCPIDFIANPNWPSHGRHILVAGGAGYIGSMLVRRLLAAGHRVTAVDRFLYGTASLDSIRENPRLTVIEADTRHIDQLAPLVAEVDAIVHLAELVGDPLCAQDPLKTMEINLMATTSLANLAARLQVDRFIYISSCSVYGSSADPEALLTETSPLAPVSIYARMKILAEQAIRRLEHGNFSPCILRLGTVFGMSHRPRFDLVVNTLTAQAVQDGRIAIFGGDQWRPHVHVQDVVRAIEYALNAPLARVAGQVINIVGENLKINDLGTLITDVVNTAALTTSGFEGDRRNYRVSGRRAEKVLRFAPSWTVREGIIEIRNAIQAGVVANHMQPHYSNIRALEGAQL